MGESIFTAECARGTGQDEAMARCESAAKEEVLSPLRSQLAEQGSCKRDKGSSRGQVYEYRQASRVPGSAREPLQSNSRRNEAISVNELYEYLITVRPWVPSGGSSVHDEAIRYKAKDIEHALQQLYKAAEYDFSVFRVIDVQCEK